MRVSIPATAALPYPSDPRAAAAVDHQRLRARLISGQWATDAQRELLDLVGAERAQYYRVDTGANSLASVTEGAAALYDLPPRVTHPTGADTLVLGEVATSAALWPTMARVQSSVLALREELVRVNVHPTSRGPAVSYTPVRIDLAELVADPARPSQPCSVTEYVEHAGGWARETWSTVPGQEPYHRVTSDTGADLSPLFGLPEGGERGPAYPFWRGDRSPILPYVLYHASSTGRLLDPWYHSEIVYGTLRVSVLWSLWVHGALKASWPQRWVANGSIAGLARRDGEQPRVSADPAIVVELVADPSSGGQVQAGQWSLSVDTEALARAVGIYEARLAQYAGVDALELQRSSGDPRSGYAMAVSLAGKRAAQRRYSPVFGLSDGLLLDLTAALINATSGYATLPDRGWQVEHVGLPPSPEERKADREEVLALLAAGLLARPEARSRLLGESVEQATTALDALASSSAEASPFASVGLPALVQAGIIGTAAARRLLGVDDSYAPTPKELAARAATGGLNA